ncbi:MAG: hypothetical protein M1835_002619, partial [Candelina submexicana]
MAPSRSRAAPEDSRSEASSTKDKQSAHQPSAASKGRRNASNAAAVLGGSSLKDVTTSNNTVSDPTNSGNNGQDTGAGIQWLTFDTSVLHSYRYAYHLATPSAFSDRVNERILTAPTGIGSMSPTMARGKAKRRISKDTLALAVRKNFNGLAVQEQEVVVDFLYKVKFQ